MQLYILKQLSSLSSTVRERDALLKVLFAPDLVGRAAQLGTVGRVSARERERVWKAMVRERVKQVRPPPFSLSCPTLLVPLIYLVLNAGLTLHLVVAARPDPHPQLKLYPLEELRHLFPYVDFRETLVDVCRVLFDLGEPERVSGGMEGGGGGGVSRRTSSRMSGEFGGVARRSLGGVEWIGRRQGRKSEVSPLFAATLLVLFCELTCLSLWLHSFVLSSLSRDTLQEFRRSSPHPAPLERRSQPVFSLSTPRSSLRIGRRLGRTCP